MFDYRVPVDEFIEADDELVSDFPIIEGQEIWIEDSGEHDEGIIELDSGNFMDHFLAVSLSLPVLAVVFIGVFLVFLTSLIDFSSASQTIFDQNGSSAEMTGDQLSGKILVSQKKAIGGNRLLPAFFTREVRYWEADIVRWAIEHDIDPLLVATVMQIESCGFSGAISRAGAVGLFQVMPYHFQSGEDGFDPETNANRGLAYLKKALVAHNGDVRLALAAYNAGIAGSQQIEELWPAETQRYIYWGIGIYEDALAGEMTSDRLQEWLEAGGESLCEQAKQSQSLP